MASPKRKADGASSWLVDFTRAYDGAQYAEAAKIYDANARLGIDPEVALLGARAHLVHEPADALEVLLAAKMPARTRAHAEKEMLLGEAFGRTGDYESADAHLAEALASAERLRDDELLSEIGYRLVRRHLFVDDPARSRSYLDLARRSTSAASQFDASHAETFILGQEERVTEQAERLVELLRSLDPSSLPFLHHRAWATHTLAGLARELYIPYALPEVERHLAGAWTDDYAFNRFQATKALGWSKALQGDYFNAFRHLRRASELATTDAWKVVAACDRSYLARCLREVSWSRQELDVAEQLEADVTWHATLSEERIGLLLLAELFASLDSSRAAKYLAKYRELGEIKSPLHNRSDARIDAFESDSTGLTELALGNVKRGLAELRKATAIFERFGYDWRVARALIAEYKATGDASLLSRASEKLRNYGQSWIAVELRGFGEQPGDVTLPPRQKRVFEEVCRGRTTAEIAKTLERSEYTINNQLKEIFRAFNVKNRAGLLAEAARRGLIQ